jgi:putative nucleotidyltransferase with HDIG domain
VEREQALIELKGRLSNENMIKHSLAVEAIMKELAEYFKEDIENWALAGLLHDIDYDKTKNDLSKHSILGAEILDNLEVDGSVVYAVKAHNSIHGIKRKRKMDKALYAADPVSGLITAAVLITKNKKLRDIDEEFVMKRFKEKGFARGANREQIKECEELGFKLVDFIKLSLDAMKKISDDLGL